VKDVWSVPKIWQDEECFILGGGPSLPVNKIDRLFGHNVIVVNNSYRLALWADALFFGDNRWLNQHGQDLDKFKGLIVTTAPEHRDTPKIHVIYRRNRPPGISEDPLWIAWNRSSGACAINLAYLMGARRIVLLGFDMKAINGARNFHDDYSKAMREPPYQAFLSVFPAIAADCKRLGVEVINATPGSAINCWPIVDPEDVLPD
jgi:hypothetical protein